MSCSMNVATLPATTTPPPSMSSSSRRQLLHEGIQLNNEGVSLALSQDDEAAVIRFSKALTLFKTLISLSPDDGEVDHQGSSGGGNGQNRPYPSSSRLALHECSRPMSQFQESSYFLFDSLLEFGTFKDSEECLPSDNNLHCAAIILNIALIYHRQARRGHSHMLIKAERFYEMVTKIISDQQASSGLLEGKTARGGTALLVLLAATNNLARIRFQAGHYVAAQLEVQNLAWLVSTFPIASRSTSGQPERQQEGDAPGLLDPRALEGVLLNILVANNCQSVAPAA